MRKELIEAYDRMTMPEDCSRRIEQKLQLELERKQQHRGKYTMAIAPTPQRSWWAAAAGLVCLVLAVSVGGTFLFLNASESAATGTPETLESRDTATEAVYEETQEPEASDGETAQVTQEDYYMMATSQPADVVEQFAMDVRNDILLRDWQSLSQKIAYPITINESRISDEEAFLELDIDGLLNSEFVKAIEEENCRRMFCNWQGVSMGNAGQIWISSREGELKIVGINDMLRAVSEEKVLSPAMEERNTVMAEFIGILLENKPFYSHDYEKDMSISEYCTAFGSGAEIAMDVPKFTVVDMDGDGENEIVLWLRVNGNTDYGTMVLRYQEGTVHGYSFSYRQLSELKADGTFQWSGSAPYNGTGVLTFTGTECTVDRPLYRESDENDEVHYYQDGAEIKLEEYYLLDIQQMSKKDVLWHVYPLEQVHGLLESYEYADWEMGSAAVSTSYYYNLFQSLAGGYIGREKSSWDTLCTYLTEGRYVWSIGEEGCLNVYFPDIPGSWFYAWQAGVNEIGEMGYYICTEDGEYEVMATGLNTDSPKYFVDVNWMGEGTQVASRAEVDTYIAAVEGISKELELEQLAVTTCMEQFSSAYFSGDTQIMRSLLADSFSGTIEVYGGSQNYVVFREMGSPKEVMQVGDTLTAVVEFKESPESDSDTYLAMELIKQQDDWKVLSYVLEK